MPLRELLQLRRAVYDARNRNEIDDKTLNDILILIDAIEIILRDIHGAQAAP
ncbi:MAG: hypothetical protein GXO32_02185 [Crenarchaeota archaeon]|nr:hypothetical protein [Thermoproteota archaeon]